MPEKKWSNKVTKHASLLNFYLNRAGKNLPNNRKKILKLAKEELRILLGRN